MLRYLLERFAPPKKEKLSAWSILSCGVFFLERLAPTRIERLSAWIALSWGLALFYSSPFFDIPGLWNLARIAPWWIYCLIMLILSFIQFLGILTRNPRIRICSGLLAVVVWSFIAWHIGLATHFKDFSWVFYIILAWASSCSTNNIARGERRA